MYSRNYWALLAVLSVGFSLFFGVGCDEDDDGGDAAPQLAVILENFYFDFQSVWIVVNSANGEDVLEVRKVTENGKTEFSSSLPEIVSLSIVRSDYPDNVVIESFMNVRHQTWRLKTDVPVDIGGSLVTAVYPRGEYSTVTIETPSWSLDFAEAETESTVVGPYPEFRLEHETMTILGIVYGETEPKAGWLLNAPFEAGTLNEYRITLDQPVETVEVTTSRPISFLDMHGHRSDSEFRPYRISYDAPNTEETTFHLKTFAFPVAFYWITAASYQSNYGYWGKYYQVPTDITIPNGTIDANYDAASQAYCDFNVQGDCDAIMCIWEASPDNLQAGWIVWGSASSDTIRRPIIPDSVLSLYGFTSDNFDPTILVLDDYHPIRDWNGYVAQYSGMLGSVYKNCNYIYQMMTFQQQEEQTSSREFFNKLKKKGIIN